VTSEYAITGQEGINPLICVWNHSSMNTFFIVRNEMVLGVQLVSFCEESNDFVAAEVGGRNFVEVYKFDKCRFFYLNSESQDNCLVAKSQSIKTQILDLKYLKKNQVMAACIDCLIEFQIDTKAKIL
jgi:hypothetical protein